MKREFYRSMGYLNDVRAIRKGRVLPRIWNRLLLRITRRFFK